MTDAFGESGVAPGMRVQLARRAQLLSGGARPLGWKVGINVRRIRGRLGIERPVVGFLTDAGLVADGGSLPVGDGYVLAEAEVAVELGVDVPPDVAASAARDAIAALLPAIEVTTPPDLSLPIEQILAGNLFHRAVAFGPRVEADAPGEGRLIVNGEETARIDADTTNAQLGKMVAVVARRLADVGEALRAGERIITGVLVMPPRVAAGERVRLDLDALGGVEIGFS